MPFARLMMIKKPTEINLQKRRARLDMIEKRTLAAENAPGKPQAKAPFVDWSAYQKPIWAWLKSGRYERRPSCPKAGFVCLRQRLMLDAER